MKVTFKHIAVGAGTLLISSALYKASKAKQLAENIEVAVSVKPRIELLGIRYEVEVQVNNPTEEQVLIGKPNAQIRAANSTDYFAVTEGGSPETLIKPLASTTFYMQMQSTWKQLIDFASEAIAEAGSSGKIGIVVDTVTPVQFLGKFVSVESTDTYQMQLPPAVLKLVGS